jgi:hypothetical protein
MTAYPLPYTSVMVTSWTSGTVCSPGNCCHIRTLSRYFHSSSVVNSCHILTSTFQYFSSLSYGPYYIRFQDQQFPCVTVSSVHAATALTNEDRNVIEEIRHQYLLTNLTRAYAAIYEPFVIDHLEPEIGNLPSQKCNVQGRTSRKPK